MDHLDEIIEDLKKAKLDADDRELALRLSDWVHADLDRVDLLCFSVVGARRREIERNS